jgi:hypothetical protein
MLIVYTFLLFFIVFLVMSPVNVAKKEIRMCTYENRI